MVEKRYRRIIATTPIDLINEIHAKESQKETEVNREWILGIDRVTTTEEEVVAGMIGAARGTSTTTEGRGTGRITHRDEDLPLTIGLTTDRFVGERSSIDFVQSRFCPLPPPSILLFLFLLLLSPINQLILWNIANIILCLRVCVSPRDSVRARVCVNIHLAMRLPIRDFRICIL